MKYNQHERENVKITKEAPEVGKGQQILNSLRDFSGLLFVQTAGEPSQIRSTENIKIRCPTLICVTFTSTVRLCQH
jgi:hypothetical protein